MTPRDPERNPPQAGVKRILKPVCIEFIRKKISLTQPWIITPPVDRRVSPEANFKGGSDREEHPGLLGTSANTGCPVPTITNLIESLHVIVVARRVLFQAQTVKPG